MSDDLDGILNRLHLANARRIWGDLVQRAEKEQWSHEQLLRTRFEEEVAHRRGTRLSRAVRTAAFPFLHHTRQEAPCGRHRLSRDRAANVLYHVVNDHHIRRKAMIFTTNKHPKAGGKIFMTMTWPRPSSTASANGDACCVSMAPPSGPSTYPPTTSAATLRTTQPAAESPEKVPQNFRNAQERFVALGSSLEL